MSDATNGIPTPPNKEGVFAECQVCGAVAALNFCADCGSEQYAE